MLLSLENWALNIQLIAISNYAFGPISYRIIFELKEDHCLEKFYIFNLKEL